MAGRAARAPLQRSLSVMKLPKRVLQPLPGKPAAGD